MRYNRFNRSGNGQKIGIGAAVLAVIGGVVFGFDETYGTISSCHVQAKSYVKANFSEYVHDTCWDSEGNSYDCSGWEYWDEPASEVFVATTIDGNLASTNIDEDVVRENLLNLGFYNVPMPPADLAWQNDSDFDDYSYHNEFDHTVYLMKTVLDENGNETQVADYTTKSENFYPRCEMARKQGNAMVVKTWYGNSYNVKMQLD